MTPIYGQTLGLAEHFAGKVHRWPLQLDETDGRYRADLDRLTGLVSDRTRLILLCNPNNPTGARLREDELDAIGAIADKHGAFVLSDEIYRGAELDGVETPSMWGARRAGGDHQRALQGVRTAGAANRLGGVVARAGRAVLEPPRLHLDRAVPALRHARPGRAVAGAEAADPRADPRVPPREPAADAGVGRSGPGDRSVHRAGGGEPSPGCAFRGSPTRRRSPSSSASTTTSSSCRAASSGSRGICASASAVRATRSRSDWTGWPRASSADGR